MKKAEVFAPEKLQAAVMYLQKGLHTEHTEHKAPFIPFSFPPALTDIDRQ